MKYKYLLFDADGTLFDFLRSEKEALRSALAAFGISASDTMIGDYSRINDSLWKQLERGEITKERLKTKRFELLIEKYGLKADAEKLCDEYVRQLSQKSYLLDGAEKVCAELSRKYRMFIITNGIKSVQKSRMSLSSIKGYFERSFISEEVGFEKPKIEFFKNVAEEIAGFSASEALVIGDSLTSDIKGGINAGIDTCWFNPLGNAVPDGMKITYVISSLYQLIDLLK